MNTQKDEFFILFADIYACLKKHRRKLLIGVLMFALIGGMMRFSHQTTFTICASFKEAHPSTQILSNGFLDNMFKQISSDQHQNTHTFMRSHFILEKVARQLGLQIIVKQENKLEAWINRIRDNYLAERNRELREIDSFVFSDVHLETKQKQKIFLVCLSKDDFELQNEKNQCLVKGRRNEAIKTDFISFKLLHIPDHCRFYFPYPLHTIPIASCINYLKNNIYIESSPQYPSILELSIKERDQAKAKRIINTLMSTYLSYLYEETKNMASEQINYLEERKNQLCSEMDLYLAQHTAYLKKNLGDKGFLSLNQHVSLLNSQQRNYLNQLLNAELEESHLAYNYPDQSSIKHDVYQLRQSIENLYNKRDALDLDLCLDKKQTLDLGSPLFYREKEITKLENYLTQLDDEHHLFNSIASGKNLFKRYKKIENFPDLFPFFETINHLKYQKHHISQLSPPFYPLLCEFNELNKKKNRLKFLQKQFFSPPCCLGEIEKRTYSAFIKHELHLIGLQEKIAEEGLFFHREKEPPFPGIDLERAKQLHIDYIKERDQCESQIQQLSFAKQQLTKSHLEYISLRDLLPDQTSQQLTQQIGELLQQKRDINNLTDRDIQRLNKKLQKKQDDLEKHINQAIELNRLQFNLIQEKIHLIQRVMVDLINREISFIRKQIEKRIEERLKGIQTEKHLIKHHLNELKRDLQDIPDRWKKEHQLAFQREMNMRTVDSMFRLVESKNIERHLIQIESKPIDWAYASLVPNYPYIKFAMLIGGFIGMLGVSLIYLSYELKRGFPLTSHNIKMRGYPVFQARFTPSNSIHNLKDSQIKTLREISHWIKPLQKTPLVITLLTDHSFNYAPLLSQLLAKEGSNVLILDFNGSKTKSVPTLSEIIASKSDPITPLSLGCDLISICHEMPFEVEELYRLPVSSYLSTLKKRYHIIVLSSPTSLSSAMGNLLRSFSDGMIVTYTPQSMEHLKPYFSWGEEGKRLAFMQK